MTVTPDQFADFALSSLAGGAGGVGTVLNTADTSLIVQTGNGALFPSTGPFMVLLGSAIANGSHELVKCTARVGDTLTITRAQEGTSVNQWAVNTTVQAVATAGNFNNIWNAINSNAASQTFNVQSYGATGNGTTDDTTAIQNAIAAAASAGGGIVFFPTGTYVTSAALTITADTIILQGACWDSVIKPASGANFDVINTAIPASAGLSGYVRNYIGVENLKIDCSNMTGSTAGAGNGIHFYGVRYSRIRRVFIVSCPNWAILLDGDNTGPGNNFGYDNLVSECVFDLCAANVYQTNCEANDFVENRFKWCGVGTKAPQPVFGTTDTAGLHLRLGSGYAYIAGNIFGKGGSYTTESIRCSNSGPCRIIGNRFDQVRNQAVVLNAGNHEFAFNALGSPGSAGTGVAAIQLGNSNNRVVGNSFDITAGAMSASYCVAESGGPFTGNIIADNTFISGTSGVVSVNGSSTPRIHHNVGYNPLGHGVTQPAVPTSGTARTNYSGVDCTVVLTGTSINSVSIGGTATGLTSGMFRVPAGQTITVNYTGSPTWSWFGD